MLDIAQDMDVGSSESSSDSDVDLTRGRQSAVSKLQFQRGEHIVGVSLEERVRNITRHARGRDGGQKGTRSERVMKRQWRSYLQTRKGQPRSDLRGVSELEGKIIAAEFGSTLAQKGVIGPTWVRAISDLRSVLHDNGCLLGADQVASTANNHLLALTKKGQRKSEKGGDRGRITEAIRRQALPIVKTMFEHLYQTLWRPGNWTDGPSIDSSGAYAGLVLGTDYGMRPSNLLRGDWLIDENGEKTRNTHYLRKNDMSWSFHARNPGEDSIVTKGGSSKEIRRALGICSDRPLSEADATERVIELYFRMTTSKTTGTTGDRGLSAGSVLRMLGRRNPEELRHLVCILLWAVNADPKDQDDCFFFRSVPRAKFIKKKAMVDGLRSSATALGLDPRNYMAKSMRTTYATHAASAGIPLAETNRMAGLVPTSTMAVNVYNMGQSGLTTALLMDIAPVSTNLLRARIALGSTAPAQTEDQSERHAVSPPGSRVGNAFRGSNKERAVPYDEW